jgi:hypothetical protein
MYGYNNSLYISVSTMCRTVLRYMKPACHYIDETIRWEMYFTSTPARHAEDAAKDSPELVKC